jgi:glycosyltransferase involved in cell wall biosynthesis
MKEKIEKDSVIISYVVPFFNEEECVLELYRRLKKVAKKRIKEKYEMIFVDDGSTDETFSLLRSIFRKDKKVKIIRLSRNFGQAAALQAGIDQAIGKIIVTLDGDLQHDPNDIPKLLEKFKEGYDIVCGWRKRRRDSFWTRRLPSFIANWLIRKISGINIHDFGTTLRVYRADLIKEIKLYGDFHRFTPFLVKAFSMKIAEVPIKNPSRLGGKSKYNLWRTKKVLLDLITVYFLVSFFSKPMQMFGAIGLFFEILASLGFLLIFYEKFFKGILIQDRPLFLLSVFISILGIQFLILGLIGEMLARIYFESQGRTLYRMEEKLSLGETKNA